MTQPDFYVAQPSNGSYEWKNERPLVAVVAFDQPIVDNLVNIIRHIAEMLPVEGDRTDHNYSIEDIEAILGPNHFDTYLRIMDLKESV